jgi:hypothetical protein
MKYGNLLLATLLMPCITQTGAGQSSSEDFMRQCEKNEETIETLRKKQEAAAAKRKPVTPDQEWRDEYWKTLEEKNEELVAQTRNARKELEEKEKNKKIIDPRNASNQLLLAAVMQNMIESEHTTHTQRIASSASTSQPVKKNATLNIMLRLLNQERGEFCHHELEYEIYRENDFMLKGISMEKTDPADNPVAPYSDAKQENKCKQDALKYIYAIKAELKATAVNKAGEKTATVDCTITQASKDLAARVVCTHQARFRLNKSSLNGHTVDLKAHFFGDNNDDESQKIPFSLVIRTRNQ